MVGLVGFKPRQCTVMISCLLGNVLRASAMHSRDFLLFRQNSLRTSAASAVE
jgi:hypothetical protein